MKKAILLTYTFPPLSSGGTPVVLNMCKYLPKHDWEVIPVTVQKHKGMNTDVTLEKHLPENLRIVRVPHGKTNAILTGGSQSKSNPLIKALKYFLHNYVLIPDRLITWRRNVIPELARLIEELHPECVISFGPHHSLHLIAMEICRKTGTAFIPFFGDLWIADSYTIWQSKLNRFVEGLLEKMVVERARAILATTEGSTGYFVDRYGSKCPPEHVTENAYDPERMGEPSKPGEKGEYLQVGWAGNFFSGHTPDELFEGFEMFFSRNPDSRIRLRMAGRIDQASLRRLQREPLAGRVDHLGFLNWNQVPDFQKSCDLLITYLRPARFAELKNSSKTAEYLISGKAVLAIAPEGNMTDRIRKYGRGYTVDPRADEIAIKLESIEYQWRTSNLSVPVDFRAIRENFSAEKVMEKLACFLDGIAAP